MIEPKYDSRSISEYEVLAYIGQSLKYLMANYIGDAINDETLLAAASDAEMCVSEAISDVSAYQLDYSVKTQVGKSSILVTVTLKSGAAVEVLIGETRPEKRAPRVRDFLQSEYFS